MSTRFERLTVAAKASRLLALMMACAALAGCGSLWPLSANPAAAAQPVPQPPMAVAWQAPLPHQGQAGDLLKWWSQFDDPVLVDLIESSQKVSSSLAAARSRIEQARAASVSASAGRLPQLDAVAGASRARSEAGGALANVAQVALQASWEIDLFGAVSAGADAGQARLLGAQAAWHAARVSVAAEVASSYLSLRSCEAQLQELETDVQSRAETARVTERSAQAGVVAPAAAAQARASAAQGRAQAVAQRVQCDALVKALVALSAQDEVALRKALNASGRAKIPQAAPFAVQTLPAQLLAQRPDLAEAAASITATAADMRLAEARRMPRVSLSGSLGAMNIQASGVQRDGTTFSLGPLQVSFPVFDGGVRRANEAAARAAYDESLMTYQARLRTAVREVEEALVQLRGSADRQADAVAAAEGYDASFKAAEARFKGGVASVFELEDARRTLVAARSALVELQRERTAAWISLYRALGGGWNAASASPSASLASN